MNERVLKVLERLEGERDLYWNVPPRTGGLLTLLTLILAVRPGLDWLSLAKGKGILGGQLHSILEKLGNLNIDLGLLEAEFGGLRPGLGRRPGLKVLEVGTSSGYSGICFAGALQELGGGCLVTVESHAGRFELARENFLEAGVSDFVRQVKGHAPEVFETDEFEEKSEFFDLIFIDSTKMEYVSYLEFVLPMLKKGGLLVADNCVSHREELGDFFAELDRRARSEELDFFLLEMDGGLMLVTKK